MRNLSLHSAGTVRTNSGVEIEKILASLSTLRGFHRGTLGFSLYRGTTGTC